MSLLREIAVFLCGFFMFKMTTAQIVLPGTCPQIESMKNFNPERYTGKWYEYQKYFFLFELAGKCITADYNLKDNGAVGVLNRQINLLTGAPTEIKGEANIINPSDPSKLAVTFPSLPVNIAAPYWVIDTDYDNYAVVWSCYEFGFFHTLNAWILTRQRDPPQFVLDKAYSVLEENNIDKSLLIKTDQTDCPEQNDIRQNYYH